MKQYILFWWSFKVLYWTKDTVVHLSNVCSKTVYVETCLKFSSDKYKPCLLNLDFFLHSDRTYWHKPPQRCDQNLMASHFLKAYQLTNHSVVQISHSLFSNKLSPRVIHILRVKCSPRHCKHEEIQSTCGITFHRQKKLLAFVLCCMMMWVILILGSLGNKREEVSLQGIYQKGKRKKKEEKKVAWSNLLVENPSGSNSVKSEWRDWADINGPLGDVNQSSRANDCMKIPGWRGLQGSVKRRLDLN